MSMRFLAVVVLANLVSRLLDLEKPDQGDLAFGIGKVSNAAS
jgi:hypothetical protein